MVADLLNDHACELLFSGARTYGGWLPRSVSVDTLRKMYDLLKWGPTSINTQPMRLVFLCSRAAKERLLPALAPGNIEATMASPVTAITAFDLRFFDQLTKLYPEKAGMQARFAASPELAAATAMRNSSMQGGYLILAARAVGLDCGPMSGFDNAKVDDEFFNSSSARALGRSSLFEGGLIRSNFLCNLGYGDRSSLRPRNTRLDFDEAAVLL